MSLRLLALLTATAVVVPGLVRESGVSNEVQLLLRSFSKPALRAHMQFLSDDLLEGRGTGTRGQEIAARYVATEFAAAGLEPIGNNGSYLQQVPLREIQVQPDACEATLLGSGQREALKWGVDYLARGNELSPDSSAEASVVFAGFGV